MIAEDAKRLAARLPGPHRRAPWSQTWTAEQEEILIAMRDAGCHYPVIAPIVGHSANSCCEKYNRLTRPEAPRPLKREPRPRRCLKCRTEFVSDTYHLCYEHRRQARDSGYCFDVP